jgi:transaldolase/glucose-6-phosphate isomerase
MRMELGSYQDRVDARLELWEGMGLSNRLRRKDATLWPAAPPQEVTDRLGWLSLGETMRPRIDDIVDLARQVRSEGITDAILLGMGGSSLAPCVFRRTFGVAKGHPNLTVLDSTHPDVVRDVREKVNPATTLFIVSSKSGTTMETLSLFRYFWKETEAVAENAGPHFIAITDPGSPLSRLGSERGFRRVFEAPPDVGGRYSALSTFGLVPAALIGADVRALLKNAYGTRDNDAAANERRDGMALGAALGELTASGKDKITILASPSVRSFPMWVEQLVAESTGKDGKGMVPIVGEPPIGPGAYPSDRTFVGLSLNGDGRGMDDRMDELGEAGHPTIRMIIDNVIELGRAMFEWELAIATAAIVMGIDPFDQPDVQATKDITRRVMSGDRTDMRSFRQVETFHLDEPEPLAAAIGDWSSQARQGDYISIQAYLGIDPETHAMLRGLQEDLLSGMGIATSMGYGPRFLHSTGQLHKGGPNTGLFLQLVNRAGNDVPVPGTDHTFGELIHAQALSDFAVLRDRGRRVLRVDIGEEGTEGVSQLRGRINASIRPKIVDVTA